MSRPFPASPTRRRPSVFSILLLSIAALAAPLLADDPPATPEPVGFPQGVASGDVGPSSAILWTRTDRAASLTLDVALGDDFRDALELPVETLAEHDFTVRVTVADLEPGTAYHYRFRSADGSSVDGTFRTAPADDADVLARFVVGGDVGGQGYCRHVDRGYGIFRPMAELGADFFIANGDMIYADNDCPAEGPEGPQIPGDFPPILAADWTTGEAREAILGHWRYNRADPHQQALLASTPIFAQWDDHEVINDFGAAWTEWPTDPLRPGYPRLVAEGKEALFLFNPMTRHEEEPGRIYRSFRWGRHLELFLLDARSYRSPNDLVDKPSNKKTMLGAEQLQWLKSSLAASDARWKIVSSDVPLSIPTGWQPNLWGRDSFADGAGADAGYSGRTGFELELVDLLLFLDQENVRNVVFVVTDVHFAASLRYEIDLDGDGDPLLFHELISGPLNAYKSPVPGKLDPTLGPIVLYAEGGLFNFSYIRLVRASDGSVRLIADIRDADGQPRFGSRLELTPE